MAWDLSATLPNEVREWEDRIWPYRQIVLSEDLDNVVRFA